MTCPLAVPLPQLIGLRLASQQMAKRAAADGRLQMAGHCCGLTVGIDRWIADVMPPPSGRAPTARRRRHG